MWQAMEAGADLVGGMPFNEATPEDSARHIALAFEIAAHHDADIDMHVDETDDPDARTLEVLAERTMENGWQGRVTAGHTCALAGYEEDYANRVIGLVRDAGIHMIVNPATQSDAPGAGDAQPKRRGITRVKELLEAGVNVSCGQDCIRDTFYPYGRGDPLEVMFLASHAAHMSRPHEIETVFDMQTGAAARTMGLDDYGAEPGCVADLAIIDADDPLEATDQPGGSHPCDQARPRGGRDRDPAAHGLVLKTAAWAARQGEKRHGHRRCEGGDQVGLGRLGPGGADRVGSHGGG